MSVYAMYFSPTGGTKKVMDTLTEELAVDAHIDLSAPDAGYSTCHFTKDEVCLIGVPSYGGRVPAIAVERIKPMRADGASAVLVVVYGNRAYDDTLLELSDTVKACGFRVVAGITAVAEHSIMRQFGAARPDAHDAGELHQFAATVREILTDLKTATEPPMPGNTPYRKYSGVPLKPKPDRSCSKCGLCAQQCPAQAIPKDNPSSLDDAKCISCMRCIAVCPQQARKLNKALLFAASQGLKKACGDRKGNELFI